MNKPFHSRPEVNFSKIVGIYLTELDHIMVKVKMSDDTFINFPVGNLESLLPSELTSLGRDLANWRFIPCCE
jgi:hypothetical protein